MYWYDNPTYLRFTDSKLHWINICFSLWHSQTKEQTCIRSEKRIIPRTVCKPSNNKLHYQQHRQYLSYCDENCYDNFIHTKKYKKNQYRKDCLEKKPFGDKNEEIYGFNKCLKTSRAQVDSFCFKEAYSYSPWSTSLNGFKTLASRLKTIFKFYIQDDFLHLLMPMSFFIGLQDGFMAKHFINVSILGVPSMKFLHSRQYYTSYDAYVVSMYYSYLTMVLSILSFHSHVKLRRSYRMKVCYSYGNGVIFQ